MQTNIKFNLQPKQRPKPVSVKQVATFFDSFLRKNCSLSRRRSEIIKVDDLELDDLFNFRYLKL